MITSTTTLVPDSPAAAYDAYRQAASAVFLAGTQGLKYRKEHYELAVDLSKAGLSYIEEEGDEIDIGAMTPLWQIKISPVIQKLAGGAVSRAISDIADKDIQRYGTLGGVISGKGAFSVLLPILLSLHVDVLLQDKGRMSLEDYLQCPPMGELVTGISIAREEVYTAYKAYRRLPSDEPYLVGAASLRDDSWRIVVGGRPGAAAIARSASDELTEKGMAVKENVAHLASEGLDFGNFGTCSEAERRSLTIEMVRSLIKAASKGYSRHIAN